MRRLRLELDQTLRTRAFVSRAVRGFLSGEETVDLIAQLAFLLWALGGERSAPLLELAGRDVQRFGTSALGKPPPPCTAINFLSDLGQSPLGAQLGSPPTFDLALCVAGTSWVGDAAEAPPRGAEEGSEFLRELSESGAPALARLAVHSESRASATSSPEGLFALAELTRGMVLGVSSYLDSAWPAPTFTPTLNPPPEAGQERRLHE